MATTKDRERSADKSGDTVELRQETEGVKAPIKADFDNPESGLIYDPAGSEVGTEPALPEENVTLKEGETVAQHEAHVLLSGLAIVQERLEAEAGPDGVDTSTIAALQGARATKLESQRVDGTQENLNELNDKKVAEQQKAAKADADKA